MESDRTIGRVLNVDSFRVVIEIDKENKSLTKAHYSGICPIARINSYVIIPVGYEKIVGHITKVQMFSESVEISNKSTITLPDVKRLAWATMIGTLKRKGEAEAYEQGITSYPCLDNPVNFILKEELDCIFDKKVTFNKEDYSTGNKNKYYMPIGKCTAFPEYEVKIDPDALFGKHLAVLGNTGSGKSCTIATLIQTLMRKEYEGLKLENAHIIIFDTNGEYASAFKGNNNDKTKGKYVGNCLLIDKEGLKIPYWFMNFEDFRSLFKATDSSQSPVLNMSLVLAKGEIKGEAPITKILLLLNALKSIENATLSTEEAWKKARELKTQCGIAKQIIDGNKDTLSIFFKEQIGIPIDQIEDQLSLIRNAIDDRTNLKESYNPTDYATWYDSNRTTLEGDIANKYKTLIDADMPLYFNKANYFADYLHPAMQIEGRENTRVREYCSTLILRMNTFFSDERYKFLFDDYENYPFALATFLRYCFGRMENAKYDEFEKQDGEKKTGKPPFIDYYFNAIKPKKGQNHQIVIFDMSLLASGILENITALLGRLMLEFAQRMGKKKEERGTFPVVLVLEEAHNYIPEKRKADEKESISKIVFERIAREGRKYGLSLVVSSQRPSELSKTVLSQCNSFIVHRIQNPEDQKYIQTIVPSINEDLLKQLPSLAQRTALIFGDCVRAPAQIILNEANPVPDSKDPQFIRKWLNLEKSEKVEPDFEKICEEWEGKKQRT